MSMENFVYNAEKSITLFKGMFKKAPPSKPNQNKELSANPSNKNNNMIIKSSSSNNQLIFDLDDDDYPVVAATKNWHVDKYTTGGLFNAGRETKYDLFFASEKHEGWAIISKLPFTDSFEIFPEIFATKEEAVHVWEDNPGIKCSIIKIEWEVEQ